MKRVRALLRRVAGVFGRVRSDADIEDELRTHVEMLEADHRRAGIEEAEAHRLAHAACGSLAAAAEAYRDRRGLPAFETLWRDARYGARLLARTPGFTVAAILSLGLGIGANATIFQLLDAVSFRGLPVAAPEQLAEIRVVGDGRSGRQTGRNRQVSTPIWRQIRDRHDAFSGVFAFGDTRFNLAPRGEIRYVEGLWVSGGFFPVLGVAPAVGRLFTAADDRPGCGFFGAVISHALWQRDFAGRPDVAGQLLHIGSETVPVIGVTPASFFGVEVGRRFDLALPICSSGFDLRDHFWLAMMGRLKPGTSLMQANEQLAIQGAGIFEQTLPAGYRPDLAKDYLSMRFEATDASAGVSPLRSQYEQPLWVLMAIAASVLLIAATNLANLMLARAAAREPEFALRLAIGGSQARVIQQVMIEGLLLAGAGALLGVLIAHWSAAALVVSIGTVVDPIYLDLQLDWRVIGLAALVAGGTSILFALAPALGAARAPLTGRGTAVSSRRIGARRALVGVQVGLSFVLVFGAGLFARSFQNLATVDAGFRTDGVLVSHMFFPEAEVPAARRVAFYGDLLEKLRAVPGTLAVAAASSPPLSGQFRNADVAIDGAIVGATNVNQVGRDYFQALGTRRIAGRDFADTDTPSTPRVAIVTEAFARQFFGGGAAVGRSVVTPSRAGEPDRIFQIVGLVQDVKYHNLQQDFQPILFTADSQETEAALTRRFVIHSTRNPAELRRLVTGIAADVSPGATIRFDDLPLHVGDSILRERLVAMLSTSFGVLALVLAAIGTYGVTSYGVARRRSEIGLRMALGARRSQVVTMLLAEVARVVAIGLGVGAVAAVAASQAARSLLFGLEPSDAPTLAAALAVNIAVALAATLVPAWRAARVSPLAALRE